MKHIPSPAAPQHFSASKIPSKQSLQQSVIKLTQLLFISTFTRMRGKVTFNHHLLDYPFLSYRN